MTSINALDWNVCNFGIAYFSFAFSCLNGFDKKILALAVKNIQASLIFLARLFVSLQRGYSIPY